MKRKIKKRYKEDNKKKREYEEKMWIIEARETENTEKPTKLTQQNQIKNPGNGLKIKIRNSSKIMINFKLNFYSFLIFYVRLKLK